MISVILTARSSQERGQEGPQLLKTVPGTCEHGGTKNTHMMTNCQNTDIESAVLGTKLKLQM